MIGSILISYINSFNTAKYLSKRDNCWSNTTNIFNLYILEFYKPNIDLNFKFTRKVKFFFKKLLPSIFSSGVTQINILVGTIIASFQPSAVSYLYYADRIYQINLAIAGIAVGTVSLPVLSKAFKVKIFPKFLKSKVNQLNYPYYYQYLLVLVYS